MYRSINRHTMKTAQEEIDEITKALYQAVSFTPPGEPTFDRLSHIFTSEARLTNMTPGFAHRMDIKKFIGLYQHQVEHQLIRSFRETETSQSTHIFRNIAHRFSAYESILDGDPDTLTRGYNSIQYIKTDDGWRVDAIVWHDEGDISSAKE